MTDMAKVGRNNRLRSRVYERLAAWKLRSVWPEAERVERSGAGRYVKGDIHKTPPVHWSVRSGVSINWRKAYYDAEDEVVEREELAGMVPAAILVDRKPYRLRYYVLVQLDDFTRLLNDARERKIP